MGFNILGFYLWGLTGLGISFTLAYVVYLVQVFSISKVKFNFGFNKAFIKIFAFQFGLALAAFCSTFYISQPYSYIVGSILFIASVIYSFVELDKRLNIKQYLIFFKNKF